MSIVNKLKTGKIKKTADILRRELTASSLPHGTRYASAREIAGRFSLSLPTAHEVLKTLVDEELLYRVRGSGTFIRQCSSEKTYNIALLDMPAMPVPQSLYDVFAARIEHMIEALRRRNCQVKVIPYYELREEKNALELLRSFDGLLVANTYLDAYSKKLFSDSGVPLVVFGHSYELQVPFSQVFDNMIQGMCDTLAEIPLSILKTAVIFTENNNLVSLWKEALAGQGVDTNKTEVITIDLKKRSLECYKNVRVHCKRLEQRLILTTTDGLAYNIIDAFILEGLQPGRDFHLISCGDREGLGFRFAEKPMITSIGANEELLMSEAVDLLLRRIENPSGVVYQARIPTYLVYRKSFTKDSILSMITHKESGKK